MTDRVRRICRRCENEEGQMFPVLLVLVLSVLALGVALLQVGRATTMRARAQTAADAAALAGAREIELHVIASLDAHGLVPRDQIGPDLVVRAMGTGQTLTGEMQTAEGDYADRNGGHVTAAARPMAFDAMVEVTTDEALDQQAAPVQSEGKQATAQSRARVEVAFLPLPPIPPAAASSPPPLDPLDYIHFTVRLVPLGG